MTDKPIEQLFEVTPFWSSANFGWTGGGIMPHFSEDGVPVSKTGTFLGDTVEHQGWNPLEGGALHPGWDYDFVGLEARAKAWEAENQPPTKKPTKKPAIKAAKKKGS